MSDYPDDIAESTRIIGRRPGREETTRHAERRPPPRVDNDPTEMLGRTAGSKTHPTESDEATKVLRPSPRPSAQGTRLFGKDELPGQLEEAADALSDPVVGWLVIVDGPGRGNYIPLGYGQNTIGRNQSERVSIDYGDAQISRESHCFIVYEPNDREFTVLRGMGKGLTYVNQKVVHEPRTIHSGELLRIGATTLRFMAFCGPEYDWQDGPLTALKAHPRTPAAEAAAQPAEGEASA
jgi:hypothetical protein